MGPNGGEMGAILERGEAGIIVDFSCEQWSLYWGFFRWKWGAETGFGWQLAIYTAKLGIFSLTFIHLSWL